MSASRFNVGGRVHPRFRIEHGRIFVWSLRGSGGATPAHRTLDYRRHRANWLFRRNVFMWPCYGSGGRAPTVTTTHNALMLSMRTMMGR